MKKWIILGLIILTSSLLAACSDDSETTEIPLPPTDEIQTITHGELEREYQLFIPDGALEGASLVIMMHGYTSSHLTLKARSMMDDVARENGFVVAYLLGTTTIGGPHWNADLQLSTIDDVGFINQVVDQLVTTYNLSEDNVFGSGFSNGAFMTYTMACRSPETFKAIAPVAGLMSGATYDACNDPVPTDILHIHGTGDLVVPMDGSMTLLGGFGGGPDVEGHFDFWQSVISGTPVVSDTLTDGVTRYTSVGTDGHVLQHIYIDDFPHTWPVSPNPNELGEDPGVNASTLIWEFFATQIDN